MGGQVLKDVPPCRALLEAASRAFNDVGRGKVDEEMAKALVDTVVNELIPRARSYVKIARIAKRSEKVKTEATMKRVLSTRHGRTLFSKLP